MVRGAEFGGGMKTLDCPVKFKRSAGDSFESRGRRGVSSSSLEDVLRLDVDNNRRGR